MDGDIFLLLYEPLMTSSICGALLFHVLRVHLSVAISDYSTCNLLSVEGLGTRIISSHSH